MKKIQISTIEKMANVQVIDLDSSFISRAVKAQYVLETLVKNVKKVKTTWDEKLNKSVPVLDVEGKEIISYGSVDAKELNEKVLPFLTDLVTAFEE